MRINRYINFALLAFAAVFAISSCEKNGTMVEGESEVLFSAAADGFENAETKVLYGGDASRYTESGKNYEKIFWSVGDVIKIYCDDGSIDEILQSGVKSDTSAKYQADYVVSEVNADKTKAKIVLNSATTPIGLRWNSSASKVHDFYAVYPAYKSVGKQITRFREAGIKEKKIYCNLYDVQNTSGSLLSENNGNYTLTPDMKWMLMHAHASYKRSTFPSGDAVFLNFQPLTTAIQFTITNSTNSNVVISKLQLLSDTYISGAFNIEDVTVLGSDGFPVAKNTTSALKQVTQDFTSSPVTLASGKTFTFTFFLAPLADVTDANKLRFRITKADGSIMTTRLGYTDGTYVHFSRCKKSFVTGIMIPEGIQWAVDYAPFMTEWEDDGGEDITLN